MSIYDYHESRFIDQKGYPFYALIMAAMRQADDVNLEHLKSAWPDVWKELQERYNAPGGRLPNDERR